MITGERAPGRPGSTERGVNKLAGRPEERPTVPTDERRDQFRRAEIGRNSAAK